MYTVGEDNNQDVMKMLGPVLDTFNQQLISNSILSSALIKVLVDKGIITNEDIKKEADKIQEEIVKKTQQYVKEQQKVIQEDKNIITPDIDKMKKKLKK